MGKRELFYGSVFSISSFLFFPLSPTSFFFLICFFFFILFLSFVTISDIFEKKWVNAWSKSPSAHITFAFFHDCYCTNATSLIMSKVSCFLCPKSPFYFFLRYFLHKWPQISKNNSDDSSKDSIDNFHTSCHGFYDGELEKL